MPKLPDIRNRISETRKKLSEFRLLKSDFRVGFTLIELLVVITIIAILIGAGTVSFTNAQKKGRDAKRKSDLKAVQQALELYFQQNGYYPPSKTSPSSSWCANINGSIADVKNALVDGGFIKEVPKDPVYGSTSKDYVYYTPYDTTRPPPPYPSKGTYELASYLENTNDPDKGTYDYSGCAGLFGTPPFNYKVTNP